VTKSRIKLQFTAVKKSNKVEDVSRKKKKGTIFHFFGKGAYLTPEVV
jgi:hypothetical protein